MRVLIGCEESQVVCQAFRELGHDAVSLDIKPTRGNPAYHYQVDIVEHLESVPDGYYGLIVVHPDCTKLTVAGNKHYGKGKPRHHERIAAAKWTEELWELCKCKGKRVCLENPVSVLTSMTSLPEPVYIHPWQYGHKEMKKTALFLHNLPALVPTDMVGPPPTGPEKKKWEVVFRMGPGPNRARDRSRTYQGIADAIAEQWGK